MLFDDPSRLQNPYPDYAKWTAEQPIWWAEDVQGVAIESGHFALEEDGRQIASLIRDFLGKQLTQVN